MIQALEKQAGDGSGEEFVWPGGTGNFDVRGTFDTATATVEFVASDGTWQSTGVARTAIGQEALTFGASTMRVTVSSSGATTVLDAAVYPPDRNG